MREYLAHISEDKQRKQTLLEHLQGTAALAKEFGQAFGAAEIAGQCGRYHDIGKYSEEFQSYLLGESSRRIDHSTAGARLFLNKKMIPQALAVAGHHAGLPDLGGRTDGWEETTLWGRSKRKLPDHSAYKQENGEPEFLPIPAEKARDGVAAMLYTRMLFSCLVDADFLDTEKFMSAGAVDREGFASIVELEARFQETLSRKGFLSPTVGKELNQRRGAILNACLLAGGEQQGFCTLTVPTGGGKTLASTAFALRQCVKQRKRRVIYVIPYTSIIEQTADVLREFLDREGDETSNVVEHHSSVNYDDEDDSSNNRLKLATENWDAPVVVTTNVQFFESIFANRTSKCRKLHNVAQSVLIFDEAQMLPQIFLWPVLRSLSLLVQDYGCTVLLASATQPPLGKMLQEQGQPCRELMQDIPAMYEFFRRTALQYEGLKSCEEMAAQVAGHDQVLCVAATKGTAGDIFSALPQGEGNIYLSTNLCPQHRRRIIADIRHRLKEGLPCRVVSTTVISIGVDVDFPVGYVELSGLDAIIQAAGRVNREGKRAADSPVHVFATEKGQKGSFMKQERGATELVQHEMQDISSPEAVELYFKELYHAKGESLDQKDIIERAKKLPFKEIAQEVRLIEEDSISVLVPYDEQAELLIARLRQGQRSRSLLRQAAAYMVNVRRTVSGKGQQSDFDRLRGAGAAELLDEGLAVLVNMAFYDEERGLLLPEEGAAIML